MYISKVHLNKLIVRFVLPLIVLSTPASIIYKLNISGFELSISYFFLALLFFLSLFSLAFSSARRHMRGSSDLIVFLSFALLIPFAFHNLNGLDLKFVAFYCAFVFSIVVGASLSDVLTAELRATVYWLVYISVAIGLGFYYLNIPMFDLEVAGGINYFTNEDGRYRLTSVLLNPNAYAYFLLVYFSFFAISSNSIINILMAVIVFIAFLLTESRSAMLSLVVIVSLRLLLKVRYRKYFFAIYVTIVVILMFVLISMSWSSVLTSLNIRFEKYQIALDYIFLTPLYFWAGVPADVSVQRSGVYFSDNMFLLIFLELGFLGFLLFVFVYLKSLYRACSILANRQFGIVRYHAIFLLSSPPVMFFSDYLMFFPLFLFLGLSIGVVAQQSIKSAAMEPVGVRRELLL